MCCATGDVQLPMLSRWLLGLEDMCCLQALAVKQGFRQKPFEWNYEGLKPLLLHEVLASKRGMSLSLCILFSCIAKRLGLALMPVPATSTGRLLHTQWRVSAPTVDASWCLLLSWPFPPGPTWLCEKLTADVASMQGMGMTHQYWGYQTFPAGCFGMMVGIVFTHCCNRLESSSF